MYFLWQERNLRYFQGKFRSLEDVCSIVKDHVRLRLLSLKIRKTKQSLEAAEIWNFHVLQNDLTKFQSKPE